jgi:hypothetical protein
VKSVGSFGSAAFSSSSSRRGERGFEFDFGGVDEFAGGGLFLLGERAELFHQRGEFAVRPDPRALGLFERGEVGRGLEFRQRGLFERFNFVQNPAITQI